MKESIEKHILKLENTLLEAIRKSDFEVLNTLLHNDLLFVIPTGQTITKQMELSNLQSGNLKVENIASNNLSLSIIGDNAIVSVVIDLKAKYLDSSINETFKYIRVWKQFDGHWKVIGGAGVPLANS